MIGLSIIALIAAGIAVGIASKHSHVGEYVKIESHEGLRSRVDFHKAAVDSKVKALADTTASQVSELTKKISQLRWEVEHPTKLKVGGKYKKDEVITAIDVVDAKPYSHDRLYSRLYEAFIPNDLQKPYIGIFTRRITTTNTKTGAIKTWDE